MKHGHINKRPYQGDVFYLNAHDRILIAQAFAKVTIF